MRSAALTTLLLMLLLVACSSSPDRHEPTRIRPTGEAAKELLRKVDLEFHAGSGPEFEAALTECCKDPLLAASVARRLMWHLLDAAQRQRGRQTGQVQLRDLESNTRFTRARSALAKMGTAAIPTVIDELMMNRFTDNRKMGVQILSAMSKDALPLLKQALVESKPKFRRHYVEAVAGMKPSPEVELLLLEWSKSEDYSVRSAAFVGLANAGDRHKPLLLDAVAKDPDTFVQRQVVRALGNFHDRKTAATVIEFYSRCQQRGDRQGMRDAERMLVKISKKPPSKDGRLVHYGLAHWRQWVLTLPVDQGDR